jgi:hypothetical protein
VGGQDARAESANDLVTFLGIVTLVAYRDTNNKHKGVSQWMTTK